MGLAPAHPYIYILFLDGVMQINLLYRDQLHYGTKLNSCRLADTPEMWLSTIMQTFYSVRNAISIDFHINRPPEMETPCYSTLGLAPTVPPPIQIHPYSGQFGTNFGDSLVQQTARITDLRLDIVLQT